MRNIARIIFILALALSSSIAQYKFGWKSEPPGAKRVYYFKSPEYKTTKLKVKSDLTKFCPKVLNQEDIGSCVAHGSDVGYEESYFVEFGKFPEPISLLGYYWDCRNKDGTVKQDAGTYISTAAWVITHQGVGLKKTWPYNVSKYATKPPSQYYAEAPGSMMLQANYIDSGTSAKRHTGIITALSNDRVVVFGGLVYTAIYDVGKDGFEPMPAGRPIRGHCRAIVGHDDNLTHKYSIFGKTYKGFYRVRNSWGSGWGMGGDSWIPYEYIDSLKYCDDFWVYLRAKKQTFAR